VLDDAEPRAGARSSATAPLEDPTEPPAPHTAEAEPVSAEEDAARPFGDSVVSAKPLDEVILDYLVENARKRRQKPAS
jgi:hypothetical protein